MKSNKFSVASCHLFQGLPRRVVERLDEIAYLRSYEQGERIFSQGDKGDAMFCVVSGRVRIDAVSEEGKEIFLNYMVPKDCFGEIAILDALPRTAGAVAGKATRLLAIHRQDFVNLLNDEPRLAIHLLQLFCERMRWTTSLFEDATFLAAPARLAKRVLSLAMLHGRQVTHGLELNISQADLARFLGVSRQVVNQNLNDWKERGWVEVGHSRLLVRDAEALKLLAAGIRDDRA